MIQNRLDVRCTFQLRAEFLLPSEIDPALITDEMLEGLQQDFNKGLMDLLVEEFDKEADVIVLHSITGETVIERVDDSTDA